MIGADENIADIDAECIEHDLHPETLMLQEFINVVKIVEFSITQGSKCVR